jgi:hypothetical protein
MYILNYKNKNIMSFPKCGCTQIIKLCTNTSIFIGHNHDFNHNNCSIHSNIHQCGTRSKKENKAHEYIAFFRFMHERIESFYNANYHLSRISDYDLNSFVNDVCSKKGEFDPDYGARGHLKPIVNYDLGHNKKITFIHLKYLNDYWRQIFNEDTSSLKIINKSPTPQRPQTSRKFLSASQIDLIKKTFEKDYYFLNKNISWIPK